MDDLHLVPVATGLSDFEAKLLAAQLGAEGILWQTRGIVDSIYPFGGIDVLVPNGEIDDARVVAAAASSRVTTDVGPAGSRTGVDPNGPPVPAASSRPAWLVLAAVGALAIVVAVRVLAVL